MTVCSTVLDADRYVGGRVTWSGRWDVDPSLGGLDAWRLDRVDLYGLLDAAAEVVVLDALSFPWDSLRPTDRDIPLVVVLPGDLDAEAIDLVLGDPVLRDLTPHDCLVESRADVRDVLGTRIGLDHVEWLVPPTTARDDVLAALEERSRGRLDVVSTEFGTFLSQSGDLITRQLVEYGAHQRGGLNMLLALTRPDDVVGDVGAHIGTFAVPVASRLADGGRVVAIEGHPATARLLEHNVAANEVGDRAIVVNRAMGREATGMVHPRLALGNTGGTWFSAEPSASPGVEQGRLDDLWDELELPAPTILKIDVEGAELDVLEGADRLVDGPTAPLLLVEVSPAQLERNGSSVAALQRWFDGHGYRLLRSTGIRNQRAGDWSLEPLERLADHDEVLFDVLAVPAGSTRLDDLGLQGEA